MREIISGKGMEEGMEKATCKIWMKRAWFLLS